VPSPPRRHGGRRGRWGQARQVGAGETGGGRRDWCSVPNGPGRPVSGQNWPGPRVTGQADEWPISTGFTLVETMGDWANHGS
jgi:hypothetical protein